MLPRNAAATHRWYNFASQVADHSAFNAFKVRTWLNELTTSGHESPKSFEAAQRYHLVRLERMTAFPTNIASVQDERQSGRENEGALSV